ncbi:unnamed protein product, partial [Urochloa humidicola]
LSLSLSLPTKPLCFHGFLFDLLRFLGIQVGRPCDARLIKFLLGQKWSMEEAKRLGVHLACGPPYCCSAATLRDPFT